MLHSLQDNLFGNYNDIDFTSSLALQDCSWFGVDFFFCIYVRASDFVDIYDVPHFIKTLKYDVRIVMSVPKITAQGKTKKLRAYKVNIFIALHTKFSCTKFTFSISLKSHSFFWIFYTYGIPFYPYRLTHLEMHQLLGTEQPRWRR